MMTILTIAFLLLLVVVVKTAVVVPMREAFVVERLGRFRGVLQPGFHIVIPFIDRIAYRQELREQVLDVPAQSCISRDNMQVAVDGLIYLKVMDPERASYGIGDYQLASVNLAQTTMRSEIGKLSLHEAFSERDKLNDAIVTEVDRASDPWGIKVLRYEVKNITPSRTVIHTLEKQMEAERERRSEVTLATAQKEATINISEGPAPTGDQPVRGGEDPSHQRGPGASQGDRDRRRRDGSGPRSGGARSGPSRRHGRHEDAARGAVHSGVRSHHRNRPRLGRPGAGRRGRERRLRPQPRGRQHAPERQAKRSLR
jgi:hypothetical protein